MKSSQQKSNQSKTSGSPSKRFLAKSRIKKGSLVKNGWYYRNVPYIEETSSVFLVLDDPKWDYNHAYWKPFFRKGQWEEEEILDEPGYTVTIMENGKHFKRSVYNLVAVGETHE